MNAFYLGEALNALRPNSAFGCGETYDSIFDASNSAFGAGAMTIIVDVTNASTFKLKWNTSTSGTVEYDANSNQQRTGFSCIKLGDT